MALAISSFSLWLVGDSARASDCDDAFDDSPPSSFWSMLSFNDVGGDGGG